MHEISYFSKPKKIGSLRSTNNLNDKKILSINKRSRLIEITHKWNNYEEICKKFLDIKRENEWNETATVKYYRTPLIVMLYFRFLSTVFERFEKANTLVVWKKARVIFICIVNLFIISDSWIFQFFYIFVLFDLFKFNEFQYDWRLSMWNEFLWQMTAFDFN